MLIYLQEVFKNQTMIDKGLSIGYSMIEYSQNIYMIVCWPCFLVIYNISQYNYSTFQFDLNVGIMVIGSNQNSK